MITRVASKRCKPHKAASHTTKGDVIDESNYFRQYIAGYCRKFLTLSNQTSRYKR